MEEELYFKGKPLSELDFKGIAEASRSLRVALSAQIPEEYGINCCCSDCTCVEEGGVRYAVVRHFRMEELYFMGKQLSELDLKEIAEASSLLVIALGAKTQEEYDCDRCAGDAAYDDLRNAWDAVAITDSKAMEAVHCAQFRKHYYYKKGECDMFDDLSLDGKYVPDLNREEVGVAARLISAELYRRNPDLVSDGFDSREAIEAAKGDLRMEDKPLKDLDYDDLDEAALLLQHRIRELDDDFHAWHDYEDWVYEDPTGADGAVMSAEKVAGISAGRIKREPFFNPFAPGSNCNPFAHLADPDRGSEA